MTTKSKQSMTITHTKMQTTCGIMLFLLKKSFHLFYSKHVLNKRFKNILICSIKSFSKGDYVTERKWCKLVTLTSIEFALELDPIIKQKQDLFIVTVLKYCISNKNAN